MNRITFVLKMTGERETKINAVTSMKESFEAACAADGIGNFSVWQMEEYLFGYGESENAETASLSAVLEKLPEGVALVCGVNTMRMMYHDIGIVREDKSLIRHRVFGTRLKPGCAEEYKRRHDGLIEARGDTVKEGPESNFTIWHGDGCIFGYCELVRAFDAIEPTQEQKDASKAWETRQLEIMDWMTDDVDWLTGEKHDPVRRVL